MMQRDTIILTGKPMNIDTPETEVVTKTRIACDGGSGGHPRVWLQIDPVSGEVECPYCDKKFVLKADAGDH